MFWVCFVFNEWGVREVCLILWLEENEKVMFVFVFFGNYVRLDLMFDCGEGVWLVMRDG